MKRDCSRIFLNLPEPVPTIYIYILYLYTLYVSIYFNVCKYLWTGKETVDVNQTNCNVIQLFRVEEKKHSRDINCRLSNIVILFTISSNFVIRFTILIFGALSYLFK